VGAGVVGDVELAVDVEDSDRQPAGLDPQRGSGGNLIGFAKFNLGGHCGGSLTKRLGVQCAPDLDHGFRLLVNRRGLR
jgi:hypothetical protein